MSASGSIGSTTGLPFGEYAGRHQHVVRTLLASVEAGVQQRVRGLLAAQRLDGIPVRAECSDHLGPAAGLLVQEVHLENDMAHGWLSGEFTRSRGTVRRDDC